ncbi:unnamed protein product [Pneumocystis jirovecii]|uniref:V-type proton ATPase proteolipid subunit n=1 Tax=Pneumocystis jirovecii TaxID=42068 RepID=L0PEI9_PNEJI|nr:unnamed protein product [Pneumocystis jirovecii]
MSISESCPSYSSFFGFAGVTAASAIGAAYGTAVSGMGIAGIGQFKQELIMKSFIPVVMSGIIGVIILKVYGLVISVLIAGNLSPMKNYSLFDGLIHLAAGLCVGMTGMASGYSIGIIGDSGVRSYIAQPKIFSSYGSLWVYEIKLIVALILNTKISHKC